ncbi:hypothetical protein DFH11DRAFT_1544659 [Phellopilus nigrolimitatus]|nr:hypothetical protein DFH11DRAFT_1544659 [Phellopilus nigrolimitatus]
MEPLFLSLLHKLLELCRRCARQSLRYLLYLCAALSRRRRTTGHSPTVVGKKPQGGKPLLPKAADSYDDSAHIEAQAESCALISKEHAPVIIACSSVPRTPPMARTHQQHARLDSGSMPMSPTSTLRDSPGAISDVGHDGPSCYPMNMYQEGPENIDSPWVFEPLETFRIYEEKVVPSWSFHVHPEGQPYFFNDCRRFYYLTELDLYNSEVLAEMDRFMDEIERKAENFNDLPTHVEVVLEVEDGSWSYYMMDLDRRCIFWLDRFDAWPIIPPHFAFEKKDHIRHLLDFEFWQHIEHFPNHRPYVKGVLEDLMGILTQGHIDVMTSIESTGAHNSSEFESYMGTMKHIRSLIKVGGSSCYVNAVTARMMCNFMVERYFNFYGFDGARLSLHQSVRGNATKRRSWLIKMLSPVLFYAPETHLYGLERLWLDRVIKKRHWLSFQAKLERDWEGFVLYSTVLLNANVAFLSIPSVLSDNNGPLWVSPAAIASQVSIIASLGSIIVGLLLVRQLRISAKESVDDAVGFLERRIHPQLGLETMSILYSLPYALLMWGMVTFLASVAIVCFFNVDGTASIFTRALYGCVWMFIVVLILWTVLTGWETTNKVNWRSLVPPFMRRKKRTDDGTDAGSDEDGENVDAQSVRSSRTRMTASTATLRTWRPRMHKFVEVSKRRLTGKWSDKTSQSSFELPSLERQ